MNALRLSASRVAGIAANTFRETVRQRFVPVLSSAAAALVVVGSWLGDCSLGAPPTKLLLDAGFGALTFFGAVVAIVAAAESFYGEIERRSVLAVLAKPVRRGEFLLGKLLGVSGLLLAFCAVGTGLLIGLVGWRHTASGNPLAVEASALQRASIAAVVSCGFVQWLRCSLLSAMTLLVSTYARSSLLAMAAGFAGLAICSVRCLACDAFQTAGSGWARGLVQFLGCLVPDFDLYDVADGVAGGGSLSAGYLAGIALYSACYGGVFVALAVHAFRHREL